MTPDKEVTHAVIQMGLDHAVRDVVGAGAEVAAPSVVLDRLADSGSSIGSVGLSPMRRFLVVTIAGFVAIAGLPSRWPAVRVSCRLARCAWLNALPRCRDGGGYRCRAGYIVASQMRRTIYDAALWQSEVCRTPHSIYVIPLRDECVGPAGRPPTTTPKERRRSHLPPRQGASRSPRKLQITYSDVGERVRVDYFRWVEAKVPYLTRIFDHPANRLITIYPERKMYAERAIGDAGNLGTFFRENTVFRRLGNSVIANAQCTEWGVDVPGGEPGDTACVTDDGIALRIASASPSFVSLTAIAIHYGSPPQGFFDPPGGFRRETSP